MKVVLSLVAVALALVGTGVAYGTDHCHANVQQRVVVREYVRQPVREQVIEYVEAPQVRVRVVERVEVQNNHHHVQQNVQKVIVQKQRQRLLGGVNRSFSIQRSVQR